MPNHLASKLPLSIIIVCRERWPALRMALDALHPQALAVGAEIIAAISDPDAVAPDAGRTYPAVTWLRGKREDSVFQLRALALSHCRAEIIGMTEDHAWVEADWCRAILDAHAQYPDAAAIGGVVENSATGSLADWAGFLIVNGQFMHPIQNGPSDVTSLQANVSYKRRALPESFPEYGFVSSIVLHQLRGNGAQIVATDRMVAYHMQALSLRGHGAAHFHNARSTAAFLRVTAPKSAWLAGYVVLVPATIARTLAVGFGKRRHRRELLLGLPLMVWLACCHAAGELIGHLAGPGDSPQRVE